MDGVTSTTRSGGEKTTSVSEPPYPEVFCRQRTSQMLSDGRKKLLERRKAGKEEKS
jgi:hypothetical protein